MGEVESTAEVPIERTHGQRVTELPPEVVEQLAALVHEAFVADRRADGTWDPGKDSHRTWAELPATFQGQNRSHVRVIPQHLAAADLGIVRADELGPGDEVVEALATAQVEHLAGLEHDRWLHVHKHIDRSHQHYVHWHDLDEATREKDRAPIRRIPAMLRATGYEVVRGTASPG